MLYQFRARPLLAATGLTVALALGAAGCGGSSDKASSG
jgi:hypothetical protein